MPPLTDNPLRQAMRKAGLNQADMAYSIGMPPSTFQKKCAGLQRFYDDELAKVLKTLNLGDSQAVDLWIRFIMWRDKKCMR